MTSKTVVVKGNKLINKSYKLTPNEAKIIYILISKINKDDKDFKPYQLHINEFIQLSGLDGVSAYTELPKITKGLMKKGFSIVDEKNNLLQVNWLSSAYHRRKECIVELEFSPKLKPFLLFLKEQFTCYGLENVIKLKSFYSMRIYELLKQYESFGKRIIAIDDLKNTLGISDVKSYDKYCNFKRNVLEKSLYELREYCDIYFNHEEIKSGRKIDKIKFNILKNNKEVCNMSPTANTQKNFTKKTSNFNTQSHANFEQRVYDEKVLNQFYENIKN